MKRLLLFAAASAALVAVVARAADGAFDTTFSGDGKLVVSWPYQISRARVAVTADGSIFHASSEGRVDGSEVNFDFAVAKLRPNGTLDSSFGFFGQRTVGVDLIPDGDDSLLGIFPLADGRVLLAGKAAVGNDSLSYDAPALVRLTAAGNVDTTFDDDGKRVVFDTLWFGYDFLDWSAVEQQPDGKLVFVADCFDCDDTQPIVAMRVTPEGELDPTFGDGGWFVYEPEDFVEMSALAIDAWGRIVLAGSFETDADPDDRPWLMRLTPSGDIDTTFGAGGMGYSFLSGIPSDGGDWHTSGIAIDTDGSIVLALDNNGAALVRTRADGRLDTSFGVFGFLDLDREVSTGMRAVAIQGDHRIVAAGSIHHTGGDFDHFIVRATRDGELDDTFAGNGLLRVNMVAGEDDTASGLILDGGRPLIAGRGGDDLDGATLIRLESDSIFASGCGD